MNILFVCLGNICRSCAAEEIFRTQTRLNGREADFCVDSAGLIDYHEGELPDPRMRRTASARGYHFTHHSRPVKKDDFQRFDLIVAMDENNRKQLLRLAPTPEARRRVVAMADYMQATMPHVRSIPDPYYGTLQDFEHVIDLLEQGTAAMLQALSPDVPNAE